MTADASLPVELRGLSDSDLDRLAARLAPVIVRHLLDLLRADGTLPATRAAAARILPQWRNVAIVASPEAGRG